MTLIIRSCQDFEITGSGTNAQWEQADWVDLQKLDEGGKPYQSRFKAMYSRNGMYVLFDAEDERISSTFKHDFDKIFLGDVFEVFFHPDSTENSYFEYEISPLDKELVLLMVNKQNVLTSWAPWPYEKENRVTKRVCVSGGPAGPGARIKSWKAELFIPYRLLGQFNNVPPVRGTRWNANFCRIDYDTDRAVKWAWAPVASSFHETDRYFPLVFG